MIKRLSAMLALAVVSALGLSALDLSAWTAAAQPRKATPPGPIVIAYRDDVSNVRQLKGTVRYNGIVGRDPSVSFTVENERAEVACNGTLTTESRRTGKFSLSCFGGQFSGSGSYERKAGDPYNSFVARGQTARNLPIMLVIGHPAGISEDQFLSP